MFNVKYFVRLCHQTSSESGPCWYVKSQGLALSELVFTVQLIVMLVLLLLGFTGSPCEDIRNLIARQRVPKGAVEAGQRGDRGNNGCSRYAWFHNMYICKYIFIALP